MAETIINCNVFQSFPVACKQNTGGVKNVWIGAYEDFSFTIDGSYASGHTIATITSGLTTLYQITPARTTASAKEEQTIDVTNTAWKQTITLVYPKNYATLRNFVASLAPSTVVCFLEDRNGIFWAYGTDNGLQVGSGHDTGTAEMDRNAWTITLESTEHYPALPVSASAMAPYIV